MQVCSHFEVDFEKFIHRINLGLMATPYWKTKDDFEMQMGVNYLGPFLLTNLLLDLLKKTGNSRIINVASVLHQG